MDEEKIELQTKTTCLTILLGTVSAKPIFPSQVSSVESLKWSKLLLNRLQEENSLMVSGSKGGKSILVIISSILLTFAIVRTVLM